MKHLHIGLIIFLGLNITGCTSALKSACSSGKSDQDNKISSGTTRSVQPYKVAGDFTPTPSLAALKDELRNASGEQEDQAAIGALRAQALRETALSLGARGGLAERAQLINGTLLNYEPLLARVFPFYGLVLDKNVLPPVLIEARNTLNLAGNDSIRIADRNYKIIAQAKFVTAPPTWREYLWMAYDMPELPDRSLLPRNKPERIMWERDLDEGWQAGLRQAELIFTENLNRMVRDFKGMILYKNLLAQNIVSQPFIATTDMGVTGDNNDMSINDKVLRITAFPELQTDSTAWKTEIYLNE